MDITAYPSLTPLEAGRRGGRSHARRRLSGLIARPRAFTQVINRGPVTVHYIVFKHYLRISKLLPSILTGPAQWHANKTILYNIVLAYA